MDRAAERSAKVGEVRQLVSGGFTLGAALVAAGVSESNYRRWAAKFDGGGLAALADRPKSGRPPCVELNDAEKECLRRIYLKSNRAERSGSMTMAARIAAHDPATPLRPETREAILAPRASKHHLPVEVRRAMRAVAAPAVVGRYRDEREGLNNGIYVPGWLRRDEETGRMLRPGERQVWDDASVNVAVAVPWAGRGDRAGDKWGWRAARYQLLAGIDCATDFFCGFGYVMRTSDGYRACDVANVMHGVWKQQGFMPKKVVLEGGSWQAKPTMEFLRTAGVGVVSAKGRPNQKLVENYFNRLWTALSIFLPGYGQIGRYRGEMRRENLNWMKVLSGSTDPRKHFPTLKVFLEALNKAVAYLRWEKVESKMYGTWSPEELYRGAAANGLPLVDGLERYALPVAARRQLRRGGRLRKQGGGACGHLRRREDDGVCLAASSWQIAASGEIFVNQKEKHMKQETEKELVETAARIAAWGEAHGMSRAQLVRNFTDLGSEKSFRDISAGSLEGYNAENQLVKYRAVYATMEELSNQGGEDQIYDDLGTVVKIRRAFLGVVKAAGTNRVLIVQGESGIGKTTAVGLLRGKYGTGRISYVEASDVWADSPNAFLGAILRALGMSELPAGRVQRLEEVQARLSISRRCLVIDEAHHLGPHCLNTVRTLVNTTPGEFILVAIPTLWNKLQAHAYQEAKQIATNRLSERVKLTLDDSDIRTYLGKRFKDADANALKVASRIIRPAALMAGNYAFVRDVTRELTDLTAETVSKTVAMVTRRR